MPRRVANLFEIVVLASGPHTLLRGGSPPRAIGRVFHAEEDLLELHHPRVREEQRRIITRNER